MNFNESYFKDAEKIVMGVLKQERPMLLKHLGKVEHEMKHDDTVVTDMDKDIEHKLKAALYKFDPSIGYWGEEHGKEGDEKNYWLIDPIDDTEQYIRGMVGSRNLITFISDDQPVFALAYLFISDDLYLAIAGNGATKNGRAIKLSNRPLERSWIEFSVDQMTDNGHAMFKKLRPHVAGLLKTYHFPYILDGSMDGLVVYKSKGGVWDYAPRALLIKEAGGRVANFGSDSYDIYNCDLIATNPVIFDEIHKILSDIA